MNVGPCRGKWLRIFKSAFSLCSMVFTFPAMLNLILGQDAVFHCSFSGLCTVGFSGVSGMTSRLEDC